MYKKKQNNFKWKEYLNLYQHILTVNYNILSLEVLIYSLYLINTIFLYFRISI